MNLVSVYRVREAPQILYELLKSRDPSVNISHKKLPTWDQHKKFIKSSPYKAWYLIDIDGLYVGSVYLTNNDEIGIFLFPNHQNKGHGAAAAIRMLIDKHPRPRYLANIAPFNEAYIEMFKKLGFKPLQHTYEKLS
jgi:RimJ/RimL family protein N-acetyltransferase